MAKLPLGTSFLLAAQWPARGLGRLFGLVLPGSGRRVGAPDTSSNRRNASLPVVDPHDGSQQRQTFDLSAVTTGLSDPKVARLRADLDLALGQFDLAMALIDSTKGARPGHGANLLRQTGETLERIVAEIRDRTVAAAEVVASTNGKSIDLGTNEANPPKTEVPERLAQPLGWIAAGRSGPMGPDFRFDDLRRALRNATPGRIRAVWPPPPRAQGGRPALKIIDPNGESGSSER